MVASFLENRFPETSIPIHQCRNFIETCSNDRELFVLKSHVLDKGNIDLFFIEFAVNDDQDAGHSEKNCIKRVWRELYVMLALHNLKWIL